MVVPEMELLSHNLFEKIRYIARWQNNILLEKGLLATKYYIPKLQLQVEHFGKMATTSGSIKAVEKCIKKFFRGLIAKSLTRTTIQFIGKMQHIVRTIVFNRNTLGDVLA